MPKYFRAIIDFAVQEEAPRQNESGFEERVASIEITTKNSGNSAKVQN